MHIYIEESLKYRFAYFMKLGLSAFNNMIVVKRLAPPPPLHTQKLFTFSDIWTILYVCQLISMGERNLVL